MERAGDPDYRRMRSQRGFTLIEVIIAMIILGLIITTSLGIFLERNRRLQQANETILVYQALANEVEVQRRIEFASLVSGDFQSDTSLLNPLGTYAAHVTVAQRGPTRKNVQLSISWSHNRHAVLDLSRTDTGGSNLW